MSHKVNGANYSYDYSELIEDLEQDLLEKFTSLSSMIDIVREQTNPELEKIGYIPIAVYYLEDEFDVISTPLEELYNRDEFSDEEWKDMEMERKKAMEQYHIDSQNFEKMTAKDALDEMKHWNEIV